MLKPDSAFFVKSEAKAVLDFGNETMRWLPRHPQSQPKSVLRGGLPTRRYVELARRRHFLPPGATEKTFNR